MSKTDVSFVPSLLAADQTCLGEALRRVEESRLSRLHIDVMDGHFVPNLSFGPQCVRDLRPRTRLFFDVHLMMVHPISFLETFAEAGADQLTVHLEIGKEPLEESLAQIRRRGLAVGLALNPETSVEASEPYLGKVDEVLVMGVHPGFG
ncbi:MAG: ribulose-phosphate 3-epimerase, partial [Puniceicoccales bacterium]|nr:ribulose-phosphate 3-epimerase [Puniceicoccales bacterium]